ncbi:integrase-like protein, partial [Rhodovulum imhoffii]
SRELGINPKTVAKWRKRETVEDRKTGPKAPRSTVLSETEEAMIVAFRRHTLLPLDDCLYALQPTVPHLTRSALHRCLQRHGISRLPEVGGDKPKRQRFKRYPIGFFHMDIAEVQTAEGKLCLFVAIDRTSKFAVTQLVEKADRRTTWVFLEHLLEAVPYRIHTILTDNGIQFAEQPRNRNAAYARTPVASCRADASSGIVMSPSCAMISAKRPRCGSSFPLPLGRP